MSTPDLSQKSKPASVHRRKRLRVATDNAGHRHKRDVLNDDFVNLARLLPGLANTRKLTKSLIVHEAIAHQQFQRRQRCLAADELRKMIAERDALVAQVNAQRIRLGEAPDLPKPPVTDNIKLLFKVDDEVFGDFLNGFAGEEVLDEQEDSDDNDDDARTHKSCSSRNSSPEGSTVPASPFSSTSDQSPLTSNTGPQFDDILAMIAAADAQTTESTFDYGPEFSAITSHQTQISMCRNDTVEAAGALFSTVAPCSFDLNFNTTKSSSNWTWPAHLAPQNSGPAFGYAPDDEGTAADVIFGTSGMSGGFNVNYNYAPASFPFTSQ
ncbi:hypothetical protein C8J56DRAFT_269360 [Mycena floridula]|nr:hypothetical protein C8J56DRAFT_269360 [Mycena floridula]